MDAHAYEADWKLLQLFLDREFPHHWLVPIGCCKRLAACDAVAWRCWCEPYDITAQRRLHIHYCKDVLYHIMAAERHRGLVRAS
eukprot:5549849-Amphidinium_carterae.1